MKTNEFLQAHIPPHVRHAHSLCCSCSPFMSSLTGQVIPHLPSRTSYRSWVSPCRPTTLQTRKPTESPLCPVSHRPAPRILYPQITTLTTVLSIDLLG